MEIDIKQLLFQVFNFSLLVFLLNKYLYNPILNLLKQREKKINEGLQAAEKNLQEEQELEKKKKRELTQARKKALAIIEAAKKEAKEKKAQILKEAKLEAQKEAQDIIRKAEEQLARQEKEFDKKLGQLVVATTEKLLQQHLSSAEIKKITQSMIKQL